MSMGGFTTDPDVKPLSKEVEDSKLRGIILHLDGKTIKVFARIENSSKDAFKELVSHFADDKIRFAVFQIRGETKDANRFKQAIFINWFGPKTSFKDKMTYGYQLESVTQQLSHIVKKCDGKNDVTRPWVLNVVKIEDPVSMDGRAVKIDADDEYSYV